MRTGKAAMRIVDVFRTLEYVGRAEGDKKSYCVFEGPHAYLVVASNTVRSYNANVVEREAVDLLAASGQKFEYPAEYGANLQSEHERYLSEQHFKCPVTVYDFPREIKPFYMRVNDDDRTVRAMDVLVPRVGEIIGGSQREERYDVVLQRLKDTGLDERPYWWYLDLRRFGTVPHSGFGLGLERMMMYLTGLKNIRDVIPFPRTPGNAEF